MMKVKLKDLIKASEISEIFNGQSIPVKVAFSLAKIVEAAKQESTFYNQELSKIAMECLQTDEEGKFIPAENGTGYLIKEDKVAAFHTGLANLDDLETEINCNPIKLDDLNSLTISIEGMEQLLPFVEE